MLALVTLAAAMLLPLLPLLPLPLPLPLPLVDTVPAAELVAEPARAAAP